MKIRAPRKENGYQNRPAFSLAVCSTWGWGETTSFAGEHKKWAELHRGESHQRRLRKQFSLLEAGVKEREQRIPFSTFRRAALTSNLETFARPFVVAFPAVANQHARGNSQHETCKGYKHQTVS
jgi:hypothetical protein